MAVLKIDVIVNDTDAEAKLDRIESKVKNVTQVSDQHRAAIDKIKDSYTNTFGAADTSAKATEKYTDSLSKASTEAIKTASAVETLGAAKVAQVAVISRSGEAWVEEQMAISKATFEMNAANAAAAEMTTAQTGLATAVGLSTAGSVGLGVALGAIVGTGALWTKFLFDSATAYLEHTGKIDEFKSAIDSIQDTWRNMQIAVGAILLSNVDDVSGWANDVKELTIFAGSWVLSYVAQQVAAAQMLKNVYLGEKDGTGALPKAPGSPSIFKGQSSVGALNTKGFFRENEVASAFSFGSPTSSKTSTHTSSTSGAAATTRADAESLQESVASLRADIQAVNYYVNNIPTFDKLKPIPPTPSMGFTSGISGSTLPGQQFGVPDIPKGPSFLGDLFGTATHFGDGLAKSIMGAVKSGSSIWANAGSFIGADMGKGLATHFANNLTGLLGGAIGAILPGVGALLGPLLGKIGGLFGMGTAGRDAVKEFSQQITGSSDMNALHALLAEKLPKDAERFWIALTQGVGRNNPQEAKRVIGEINDALSHAPLSMEGQASQAGFSTTAETQRTAQEAVHLYEFMRDSGQYSASVVEAAWKRANDAMIASGDKTAIAAQKAKDSVVGLAQQIDSLTQSIANEAPEEVMGVVEQQARAQIAALEEQRTKAQSIIDQLNAQSIVIPVRLDVSGIDWPAVQAGQLPPGTIKFPSNEGFEAPEGEVPEMARGGIVRARRGGTLVRVGEAGQDEMISPLGSGVGGVTINIAGSLVHERDLGQYVAEVITKTARQLRAGA